MKCRVLWWPLTLLIAVGPTFGCGDEATPAAPDVSFELPPDPVAQSVTVALVADLGASAKQSYTVNGVPFEITIDSVHVVVGNLSVLAAGDPVPAYSPDDAEKSPLGTSVHSVAGYQVAELVAGGVLGPVEVPEGHAGPIYFAVLANDGSADPVQGANLVDGVDGVALVLNGTILIDGSFEAPLQLRVAGDYPFVLGAPSFALDAPRTATVRISVEGWFADMDATSLSKSTDTFVLDATSNTVAYEAVSPHVVQALEGFAASWD